MNKRAFSFIGFLFIFTVFFVFSNPKAGAIPYKPLPQKAHLNSGSPQPEKFSFSLFSDETTQESNEESAEESKGGTAKMPGWVKGQGHPKYPQSTFLTGVGSSQLSSVSANESARAELAKSLKVDISSTMKDFSSSVDEQTRIEDIISTKINASLEGVEIKDGWYDLGKDIYYAFAVVERNLLAAAFKKHLKNLRLSIKARMKKGTEAERQGEVITALQNYLSGFQEATSEKSMSGALGIISASQESSQGSDPAADKLFSTKIQQIVQGLKIEIDSGNQQKVKTKKHQLEPLVVSVYYKSGEKKNPVPNIPLVFKHVKGDGELVAGKKTDSHGKVETTVRLLNFNKNKDVHNVAASLDCPDP